MVRKESGVNIRLSLRNSSKHENGRSIDRGSGLPFGSGVEIEKPGGVRGRDPRGTEWWFDSGEPVSATTYPG